jgi:hypothetical protein
MKGLNLQKTEIISEFFFTHRRLTVSDTGNIERGPTAARWKARFMGYREWHMEKLNGRLSLSDGKYGFWDIVSGTWKS